jgi:hypothetical protein
MSKWAAIDTAVRLQLALDGREINYSKTYAAPPPAGQNQPAEQVPISAEQMGKFLLDVANRLRFDKPPLVFAWRQLEPGRVLGNKLAMIVCLIEDLTEEAKDT